MGAAHGKGQFARSPEGRGLPRPVSELLDGLARRGDAGTMNDVAAAAVAWGLRRLAREACDGDLDAFGKLAHALIRGTWDLETSTIGRTQTLRAAARELPSWPTHMVDSLARFEEVRKLLRDLGVGASDPVDMLTHKTKRRRPTGSGPRAQGWTPAAINFLRRLSLATDEPIAFENHLLYANKFIAELGADPRFNHGARDKAIRASFKTVLDQYRKLQSTQGAAPAQ